MQQVSWTCCVHCAAGVHDTSCPLAPTACTVFTQSTRELTVLTHASCAAECLCVYSVYTYVCVVYQHTVLPLIFFPLICYPCAFNMRVITVDTALLRRRLGVLLWADIRASMSSSASSSENSCGWQHSDLIKRKLDLGSWLVSLYFAVLFFSSLTQQLCVGACAASFHKFNQTSQDRAW